MKKLPSLLYSLLQCTWGLPQTLAGFFVFLWFRKCPHRLKDGIIATEWTRDDGVSLGMFVFFPPGSSLRSHEYGHTIQSGLLGPLYLPAVCVPSFFWCGLPYFQKLRRTKRIPYSRLYCEAWADRLGKRFPSPSPMLKPGAADSLPVPTAPDKPKT